MAKADEQLAGTLAKGDGPCLHPECETGQFLKNEPITRYKDGWMHVRHAAGFDDDVTPKRQPRKRAAKKTTPAPVAVTTKIEKAVETDDPDPIGDRTWTVQQADEWIVTEPGLVEGMPNDVYHSDPWPGGSVSNSDAQLLLEAPALYRWRRDNPLKGSRQMNLGSAAHTRVLGEGDKLVKIDAAEYRTNDAKAARDRAYAYGLVPLLGISKPGQTCEWDVVDAMAEALERDPLAPYLFSAGTAEVSAFWVDPETSVPRRARFDFLPDKVDGKRMIVPDYKTTEKSLAPGAFARSAVDYGYDMQDDTYTSALVALDIDPDPGFVFVVQSVKPPYLIAVHELTQQARARGHARTLRALRRWKHCMETGVWYGWEGKVHQVDLPAWAYQAEEIAQAQEPTW